MNKVKGIAAAAGLAVVWIVVGDITVRPFLSPVMWAVVSYGVGLLVLLTYRVVSRGVDSERADA